jgi:hypothetical protein
VLSKTLIDPIPQSLTTITAATRMLAEAKTLEDCTTIRDLGAAALTYAKAKGLGVEAQNYATDIIAQAERRGGEIKNELQATDRVRERGRPAKNSNELSISDLGIGYNESANWTNVATLPTADFNRFLAPSKRPKAIGRLHRIARDARAKQERRAKATAAILPATCDLRLGDFREVLADIPDGSVDVVLTDPPYPAEFLPLWSDLGALAARVLRPGGLLVAMSGQMYMPAVMALLGEHLPFRWIVAYLTPGQGASNYARRVEIHWKPVLVYGGIERSLHDVVRSDAPDKEHHDWGQSESGMAALLRQVADPGQVVCDPFVGGGTTGVVALAHGCSFIGAEIDQVAYETALARLAP